jgi:putative FmdB family regulatory protein
MPLYEYQCESCEHRFERIQKFSDPPVEACPKCGGPVTKLVSSPAFQFKGTGWYVTDYARKSEKPSEGGSSEKPDSGGAAVKESSDKGAADKPAESKAEPKAESKPEPSKT